MPRGGRARQRHTHERNGSRVGGPRPPREHLAVLTDLRRVGRQSPTTGELGQAQMGYSRPSPARRGSRSAFARASRHRSVQDHGRPAGHRRTSRAPATCHQGRLPSRSSTQPVRPAKASAQARELGTKMRYECRTLGRRSGSAARLTIALLRRSTQQFHDLLRLRSSLQAAKAHSIRKCRLIVAHGSRSRSTCTRMLSRRSRMPAASRPCCRLAPRPVTSTRWP